MGASRREPSDGVKALQTVGRAAALLAAFRLRTNWRLSALSEHLGISKSMTHRLLHTLAAHGLVAQDAQTREFRVGPLVHEISFASSSGPRLRHVARHLIGEAAQEIDETIAFCQLKGMRGVCLESLESSHSMRMTLRSGESFALNAGAIGKVLLAHQDAAFIEAFSRALPIDAYTENTITDPAKLKLEFEEIRRKGAAFSHAEITPDATSVAVPVRGPDGRVEYCLAASGPASRFDATRRREAEQVLRRVADKLAGQMGGGPAPAEEGKRIHAVQSCPGGRADAVREDRCRGGDLKGERGLPYRAR